MDTVTVMAKIIMKKSITVTVLKFCMRIPAINSDFNPIICQAISQSLDCESYSVKKQDLKAGNCHAQN